MWRIPSFTSGLSDLLMFISGLALLGYLLIMAPVAGPNIVSSEGSISVLVMAAASKHATIQEELRPPSGRLRNDLRWYLLATAATSRNRYPSPFATQTNSNQAAAHHRHKPVILAVP